jgi:hypothetical protein
VGLWTPRVMHSVMRFNGFGEVIDEVVFRLGPEIVSAGQSFAPSSLLAGSTNANLRLRLNSK